ncbi:unnamed protein product, partial [Nesidiocoris tenuis]
MDGGCRDSSWHGGTVPINFQSISIGIAAVMIIFTDEFSDFVSGYVPLLTSQILRMLLNGQQRILMGSESVGIDRSGSVQMVDNN